MRMGMRWIAATALTVGLLVSGPALAGEDKGVDVGEQAPNFSLKDQDGNTVTLSQFEDQIVVLEWFNSGCPFVRNCYKDKKVLKTLPDKYQKKGVVWLAINSTKGTGVASNQKIAEKWGIDHRLLDDSSGKVGRVYDAKTTPHMFIIDRDGKVVYEGAIDNNPMSREPADQTVNYVDRALQQLLAGEPIAKPETKPYGCSVKYAGK